MRDYEIVYIFDSTLEEDQVGGMLDRFHEQLESGDGEVTEVDHWGRRKLAYPLDDRENGYYVVVQFTTEPARIQELEGALKMEEGLLRHLIVLDEGQPTGPTSPGGERLTKLEPEEEEEEAEEEEAEEEEA